MLTKLLKTLAVALVLLWGGSAANAGVWESTETDDLLNAAGEVTTAFSVEPRTTLTIFLQGGAYVLDVYLQREIGSPGSGAYENVMEVSGATGVEMTTSWVSGNNPEVYRLFVTGFTSGSVTAQVTDNPITPFDFGDTRGNPTYIHWFEDFYDDEQITLTSTTVWKGVLITDEDDGSGTVAITTMGTNEGVVTIVSGTSGSLADTVFVSMGVVTNYGSLVSSGRQMFETRLQYNDLTGSQVAMALHDVILDGNADEVFDFTADEVGTFATGVYQDGVGIIMDDDTVNNEWHPFAAFDDVEINDGDAGGAGEEFILSGGGTVSTYDILRVEVEASGDCYFFVDGVLRYAHNQCMATDSVLIPIVWVNTSSIANDATTVAIDYMWFAFARPSS